MFAQYVFFLNTLLLSRPIAYFQMMLGRLNARTRFRAMAEESIPLSSISLGGTSSVEPVDREMHAGSKNLIYFYFFALLNFCYKA
jgi:hypothetical protein